MTEREKRSGRSIFEANYLRCVSALDALDKELLQIGIGRCHEFRDLQQALFHHGAETFAIMEREDAAESKLK